MPVLELVAAARQARHLRGVDGLDGVVGLFLALQDQADIARVHREEVVAVDVLELHLPVGLAGVTHGATQQFKSIRGLVRHGVDDRRRATEVLLDGWHRVIEAAENEAPVYAHLYPRQIVRQAGKVVWIAATRLGVDVHAAAAAVVHPAVIGAGQRALVATFAGGQLGAAVREAVQERVHLPVVAARDQHGLEANAGGNEVVDVRNLALVRQVYPRRLEDVAHLQFEYGRVRENAPRDLELALLRRVLHAVQQFGEVQARAVGHLVHGVSPAPGQADTGVSALLV